MLINSSFGSATSVAFKPALLTPSTAAPSFDLQPSKARLSTADRTKVSLLIHGSHKLADVLDCLPTVPERSELSIQNLNRRKAEIKQALQHVCATERIGLDGREVQTYNVVRLRASVGAKAILVRQLNLQRLRAGELCRGRPRRRCRQQSLRRG